MMVRTKLALAAVAALLAAATARDLSFKTKESDEMYVESKSDNNTIGYLFTLHQNVLSIQINATLSGKKNALPNAFAVMPNLILEYDGMNPANSTSSIYGFLDKANANTDWGNGLTATKFSSKASGSDGDAEVWEFAASWANPDGEKPGFDARMYITSEDTEFEGLTLSTNAIAMRFSILDFPFKFNDSTLALDQLVLSEAGVRRVANLTFDHDNNGFGADNLGALRVNRTAIVDEGEGIVHLNQLDNSNNAIVAGNSTDLDVTGFNVDNVLVSFTNSTGAKNVTFQQRLVLDLDQLRTGVRAANAATEQLGWNKFVVLLSALAVVLPVVLL